MPYAYFLVGFILLSLLTSQPSLAHFLVVDAHLISAISKIPSYCLVICIALLLGEEFGKFTAFASIFANLALFSWGPCTSITFDNQTIRIAFTGCKCRADARNFAIFILLHCLLICIALLLADEFGEFASDICYIRRLQTGLPCLVLYSILPCCLLIWWTPHVFQIHQIYLTRHLQRGPSCLFIIIIWLYCIATCWRIWWISLIRQVCQIFHLPCMPGKGAPLSCYVYCLVACWWIWWICHACHICLIWWICRACHICQICHIGRLWREPSNLMNCLVACVQINFGEFVTFVGFAKFAIFTACKGILLSCSIYCLIACWRIGQICHACHICQICHICFLQRPCSLLMSLINFAKFAVAGVSRNISITSYGIYLLHLSHFVMFHLLKTCYR